MGTTTGATGPVEGTYANLTTSSLPAKVFDERYADSDKKIRVFSNGGKSTHEKVVKPVQVNSRKLNNFFNSTILWVSRFGRKAMTAACMMLPSFISLAYKTSPTSNAITFFTKALGAPITTITDINTPSTNYALLGGTALSLAFLVGENPDSVVLVSLSFAIVILVGLWLYKELPTDGARRASLGRWELAMPYFVSALATGISIAANWISRTSLYWSVATSVAWFVCFALTMGITLGLLCQPGADGCAAQLFGVPPLPDLGVDIKKPVYFAYSNILSWGGVGLLAIDATNLIFYNVSAVATGNQNTTLTALTNEGSNTMSVTIVLALVSALYSDKNVFNTNLSKIIKLGKVQKLFRLHNFACRRLTHRLRLNDNVFDKVDRSVDAVEDDPNLFEFLDNTAMLNAARVLTALVIQAEVAHSEELQDGNEEQNQGQTTSTPAMSATLRYTVMYDFMRTVEYLVYGSHVTPRGAEGFEFKAPGSAEPKILVDLKCLFDMEAEARPQQFLDLINSASEINEAVNAKHLLDVKAHVGKMLQAMRVLALVMDKRIPADRVGDIYSYLDDGERDKWKHYFDGATVVDEHDHELSLIHISRAHET